MYNKINCFNTNQMVKLDIPKGEYMISEYLFNKILELGCSVDNSNKHINILFTSINNILNKSVDETYFKTNPNLALRYELCSFLIKYRLEHRHSDFDFASFLDTLDHSKFKNNIHLIKDSRKELSEEYIEKQAALIFKKEKLTHMLDNQDSYEELLNDLKSENYETIDSIINKWDGLITESYKKICDSKQIENLNNCTKLDLTNDDYNPILTTYKNSYKESKIMKSGYDDIDNYLPFKGFEKRRVYLFGGETGVGKSALLINIISNAVRLNKSSENKETENFIYITAENLIDESLIRFYCCFNTVSIENVINRIMTEPEFHIEMKKNIVETLKKFNVNIMFYYVERKKTTLLDIEAIVRECSTDNKKIKSVFIDYLDLISSGMSIGEFREELGAVASGFKQIAINYDVALLTLTQLNKSGYHNNSPSVTAIKESMAKAENVDFVALLQKADPEFIEFPSSEGNVKAKVIDFSIVKQRNGPSGHRAKFLMIDSIDEYPCFNFKIIEKPDSVNATPEEVKTDFEMVF